MFETRIPEPAIMDDLEACREYDKVDRDSLTFIFTDLMEDHLDFTGKAVAELGCGTGEFTRAVADMFEIASLDAYDGSQNMLDIATSKGVPSGVTYKKELFENITETYDIIFSAMTMHHSQTANEWWDVIMQMSKPGTKVFIMDLLRPKTKEALDYILSVPGQPNQGPRFRADFEKSCKAAFNIDEVETALRAYPDLELATEKVRLFSTNWYFMSVIGQRI